MAKKKKIPKPRNPFVQHLVVKKQGAHNESKKGKRSRDKVNIRKEHYDKEFLDGIFCHSVLA